MWVCKTCGQINEDTDSSCMLCGSTDREKYETAPAPKVVIPPPEERVAKKPTPKIDTSLKRPSFGTGTSATTTKKTTGTGGTGRSSSGIDTTIRRPSSTPTTTTRTSTSSSTRTSTSATTRSSTGTSTSSYKGTSGSSTPTTTPVKVKPHRWWRLPLIFFIASLVSFYPVSMLAINKGVYKIAPIMTALPIIAVILFIQRACFHRGAGVLGFIYQIALTVGGYYYIDHLLEDVFDVDLDMYLLMAATIFLAVLILKICSIVRFFRAGRKGLAIPLIFLACGDFFFFLAAF